MSLSAILPLLLRALPWLFVFGLGSGISWWIADSRITSLQEEKAQMLADWKAATRQTIRTAERQQAKADKTQGLIDTLAERLNRRPVAERTRVEKEFVYLDSNNEPERVLHPADFACSGTAEDHDTGGDRQTDETVAWVNDALRKIETLTQTLNALNGVTAHITVEDE